MTARALIAVVLAVACHVDPSTLESCGDHCSVFPSDLVSDAVAAHLKETSPGFLCVPDRNVAEGKYTPLRCASIFDLEGRCLGACIPEVGKYAPLLSRSTCWAGEVCAPCVNPFTGGDTSACSIGTDRPEIDGGAI